MDNLLPPENPEFSAIKLPREYSWNINGVRFMIIVPVWNDDDRTAREILQHDLEYIAQFLSTIKEDAYIHPDGTKTPMKKPFHLPPVKPEDKEEKHD